MLAAHLPDLAYSAGILGGGSEVLGFDTEMSADHDWGPKVMLFLSPADLEAHADEIRALALEHLPLTYKDYPVRIYARDRFAWYPRDTWLYLIASCWTRIGEAGTLTGRAGSVGDHLGSAVIAWRLVRDVMRLAFLMERSYPPYARWLGSAFAQLRRAPTRLCQQQGHKYRSRRQRLTHLALDTRPPREYR